MITRAAVIALASLAAATVSAAPASYTVDSTHAFPSFEIGHMGFSTQRGRFNRTTGNIQLDLAARKIAVDISIDANSISTGYEKLEEHLRAEDFFDTAKYPTITFKSTGAVFKGGKLTSLTGNLNLHGVTKPVTLTVNAFRCAHAPLYKKDVCGADAVATIKRSDFGMGYGIPAVDDQVKLQIQIESHKN